MRTMCKGSSCGAPSRELLTPRRDLHGWKRISDECTENIFAAYRFAVNVLKVGTSRPRRGIRYPHRNVDILASSLLGGRPGKVKGVETLPEPGYFLGAVKNLPWYDKMGVIVRYRADNINGYGTMRISSKLMILCGLID